MRLPRLPNSFVKARSQTVQFLGINLTENFQDGEMNDCKNLSTLQYPTLTQRKGREALEGYDNMVTDIFEWDGKLIVVSNGTLYVDGDPIASVTDTKKQFAVVNSRLVVFPDKVSIDLRNNEFKELEATVRTTGVAGSVTFTHNSLTATLSAKIKSDISVHYLNNKQGSNWYPFFYTYGTSIDAVKACWNDSTSTWDMNALSALQVARNMSGFYGYAGHIIIPELSGLSSYDIVVGDKKGTSYSSSTVYPDTSTYNTAGHIGVITRWSDDDDENYVATGNTFDTHFYFDVYDIAIGQEEFINAFEVGDYVDITGSPHGLLDTTYDGDDNTTSSKKQITGITEETDVTRNTLTFPDNTFHIPYAAVKVTSERAIGQYYILTYQSSSTTSNYYFKFTTTKRIKKGQVVVIYGVEESQQVCIWDIEQHKIVATYTSTRETSTPTAGSGYTSLGRAVLYNPSTSIITISRSVPDLDFICERDNRLWGVSNSTKTIYCSALGLPWQFYDYNGLDTGAYAVAVGSAGDFTGIVDYGGVLCFKENCVHKMLGSFPSDFYMTTYNVAGIMSGAEKSAVIISEVLYYRSALGVMAFTGYQPTNISPNLALENTKGGVGGTNGQEYYLCVQAKDESHHSLFKYDLMRKLWTKEEDIDVTGMANIGNNLYLTIHTQETIEVDGTARVIHHYTPYATGQENEEGMNLEWFAQFKPYTETEGGIRKAGYTRLVLRFDMAPGSVFKIKVRYDNGLWEDAWTQPATPKLSHTVPLRIKRCDKFELRLEGNGQTKIRSIVREFVQGGWFENGSGFYR